MNPKQVISLCPTVDFSSISTSKFVDLTNKFIQVPIKYESSQEFIDYGFFYEIPKSNSQETKKTVLVQGTRLSDVEKATFEQHVDDLISSLV